MAETQKQLENQETTALRFRELAFERRRPSKRTTTLRTFSVVRNWEKKAEPTTIVEQIKDFQEKLPEVSSPEFLPPVAGQNAFEHQPDTSDAPDMSPIAQEHEIIPTTPLAVIVPSPKIIIPVPDARTPTPVISAGPRPSGHTLSMAIPLSSDTRPGPIDDQEEPMQSQTSTTPSQAIVSSVINETPSTTATSPVAESIVMATQDESIVTASPSVISTTHARSHEKHATEQGTQHVNAAEPSTNTDTRPHRTAKAKRGQKRKQPLSTEEPDEESIDKRFVRLYNADQGRHVSVADITELDVVLTEIEEIALQYREDIESSVVRQAIKEYFIQIRKQFSDCIDLSKEYKTLKSQCTKVNTKVGKIRKELLSVQQRRSRMRGELAVLEKEHKEQHMKNKDLSAISQFLYEMEYVKEKRRKNPGTNQDCTAVDNLPALMCEANAMLSTASGLKQFNDWLESWLQTVGNP